jgi:hypothetical protein
VHQHAGVESDERRQLDAALVARLALELRLAVGHGDRDSAAAHVHDGSFDDLRVSLVLAGHPARHLFQQRGTLEPESVPPL